MPDQPSNARQAPAYSGGDVDPSHPQLGLLLRLAHQQWTQAIEAALADAGFDDIRPPHANVFTFARPEGIQVSELTRLARVRKQTMAQAVEELEALGYVERRPDPNDRRARLVFLTKRGEKVRPIAVAAGRRVATRWAELTSPKEMESLQRSLEALLTKLQNETDDTTPGQGSATPKREKQHPEMESRYPGASGRAKLSS